MVKRKFFFVSNRLENLIVRSTLKITHTHVLAEQFSYFPQKNH